MRVTMTDRHKKIAGLVAVGLIVIFVAAVFWFVGRPMIAFVEDPDRYQAWIEDKGFLAQISFVGMVLFQVIFAVIPGEPLEICAGYAFGTIEGTILCMIGIAIGSAAVFWLVRRFGIKLVELFFSVEKIRSLAFLRDARRRNMLVFLLMFIPGTPKDLLSYFVGLTDMKLSEWLIITSIARIPSVVTSTIGGSALAEQRYIAAVIVFAVTAAISITGIWLYGRITRRRNEQGDKTE